MNRTQIDAIFEDTFNGNTNLMTPVVIRRGARGKYLYELSVGSFMDKPLFGITVLDLNGQQTRLSTAFDNKPEAEDYIKLLRNEP